MNWSKVKSIMIVFLILVNLSLLSYIVYEEISENNRNAHMAQTVTALLSTRNISVDKKLVLGVSEKTSAQSIYVDNVIRDYETFSKSVLGENIVLENSNKYKSENGTISYKGDYFEIKALKDKVLYEEKINKLNAPRIAEKYLNFLGFDTKNSEKIMTQNGDNFKVSFNKKINEFPVFKIGVTIEMTEQGIHSVYGSWYNISSQNSSLLQLKSISGILVEYMNKITGASEITDISLGYSTLESGTFHESVMLTPVWKITNKNGDILYIDARENN